VTYVSEIHDGGDYPKFSVTQQGAPGERQYHHSATAAWTAVIKRIQDSLTDDKKGNTAVSGPEYFGFAHPTIARLIQELPNVNKLPHYKMLAPLSREEVERRKEEDNNAAKPLKKRKLEEAANDQAQAKIDKFFGGKGEKAKEEKDKKPSPEKKQGEDVVMKEKEKEKAPSHSLSNSASSSGTHVTPPAAAAAGSATEKKEEKKALSPSPPPPTSATSVPPAPSVPEAVAPAPTAALAKDEPK
jgi:hypothetical protein